MNIHFHTKNLKLTPQVKEYIETKLERIIKYAGKESKDIREIHIDLSYSPQHRSEEKVRVEVNIDLYHGQKILRAAERAEDLEKGIDLVQKKLERQIEKMK